MRKRQFKAQLSGVLLLKWTSLSKVPKAAGKTFGSEIDEKFQNAREAKETVAGLAEEASATEK